jgi:uncharacterized repeat protein (TIGR01451 family)
MNFMKTGQESNGSNTFSRLVSSRAAVSAIALMTALAPVVPAWATIDNTVTATGSSPGNTDDITATDTENVDVEDADPQVVTTKTATLLNGVAFDPDTANVGVGDVITYEYTFLNDGNVTITNISLTDVHDGNGTLTQNDNEVLTDNGTTGDSTDSSIDAIPSPQNGVWDSLAPGDLITLTSTYTVTQADIDDNGGGDNDLDNTVTFSATPAAGSIDPADLTVDESVDLEDAAPSLNVDKLATLVNGNPLANPDAANVAVGDVITYTYTVTNDGNVPISAISLADSVTAGTGGDPTPILDDLSLNDVAPTGDSSDDAADESFDVLGVGDSVEFTGTYTVTQDDVDNLQ